MIYRRYTTAEYVKQPQVCNQKTNQAMRNTIGKQQFLQQTARRKGKGEPTEYKRLMTNNNQMQCGVFVLFICLLCLVTQSCLTLCNPTDCSLPGFPGSSAGRESACNAGDPRLIPLSGRSTGEGIGYPLQYSQASLVAKLVKNLPAMQETWV